jgi:predicted Na+-dependent transporter
MSSPWIIAGFVAAAGGTTIPEAVKDAVKGVPIEAVAALLLGLVAGYFLGRFFGDDLAESRTFGYLSGKRKLRD